MRLNQLSKLLPAVTAIGCAHSANAGFTVYKNAAQWTAATNGPITTLDFIFPPDGAFLSDQYESLGVLFPEGEETSVPQSPLFQLDGWGCKGAFINDNDIHLKFLAPQYSIGAWFPGDLDVRLYWQGQLIYTSPQLDSPFVTFQFGGVVSTTPFDEVILKDQGGAINIDNIVFASQVPAPPTFGLVVAGLLCSRRRRT